MSTNTNITTTTIIAVPATITAAASNNDIVVNGVTLKGGSPENFQRLPKPFWHIAPMKLYYFIDGADEQRRHSKTITSWKEAVTKLKDAAEKGIPAFYTMPLGNQVVVVEVNFAGWAKCYGKKQHSYYVGLRIEDAKKAVLAGLRGTTEKASSATPATAPAEAPDTEQQKTIEEKEPEKTPDFESITVASLKEEATKLGIKVPSKIKKSELIALLKGGNQ